MSKAADVVVRPLSAADIDQVLALDRASPTVSHWFRADYEACLHVRQPRRAALVAVSSKETQFSPRVAGFLVANLTSGDLESIVVALEDRRRYVGSALFAGLRPFLEVEGVTELHLEVRQSNTTAVAFYRRLGFEPLGRRPGYYANPEEDALVMTLRTGH